MHAKEVFTVLPTVFFGKIGRPASEEVVLQLISTKYMPILLYGLETFSCYGLETFSLYNYQLKSLDFVINIFFNS